jgi:glycosyltransferase involved in cell wall biosynthesis
MRILHVVHGYPPSVGGSQWVMKNLSEQMSARHHDEVTVYTTTALNMELFWRTGIPALPAGIEQIEGVTVRRFPVFSRFGGLRMLLAHGSRRLRLPYNDWLRTIYNGPIVFGMTRAIAEFGADVIAATAFPHLHMHYALAGARRGGTPLVYLSAIHAADEWGFDRRMIYRAIEQADATIAYTAFERDHLVARGIRPEKITVIGAGVDAAAFAGADGAGARRRYGWGDEPIVAIVAKQGPHKRFDTLLAAMPQVWARDPSVRLLIAGARTPYSHQIDQAVNALPPQQRARVTVIGDFPEEEKVDLLAACDVFALPSGHESFGIAFLEAWACGKPVIGARIGAVPSVIDDGRDGLLVAYQDAGDLARAIDGLLSDPQRRREMGASGREKVLRNHNWDIVADRVRDVYARVVESGGHGRVGKPPGRRH